MSDEGERHRHMERARTINEGEQQEMIKKNKRKNME